MSIFSEYRDHRTLGHAVDQSSFSVCKLEMWHSQISLGIGTAFFYRRGTKSYIVTNWHNIMGRDPATGQPRSDDGVVPNRVTAALFPPVTMTEGAAHLRGGGPRLFESEVEHWFMHPDGQAIDIAGCELPEDAEVYCLNDRDFEPDPHVTVGLEAFIIGYPRGIRSAGIFPIWKRASIASEPALTFDKQPCLLLDSATREGMSGSPVLARVISREDDRNLTGPFGSNTPIILQKGLAFLGMYSGRIGVKDAFEARIGKVWLPGCIDEMLALPQKIDWDPIPRSYWEQSATAMQWLLGGGAGSAQASRFFPVSSVAGTKSCAAPSREARRQVKVSRGP